MSRRRAVLSMLGVLALVAGIGVAGAPAAVGHSAWAAKASDSGSGSETGTRTLFREDFEGLPAGQSAQALKSYRGGVYAVGISPADSAWLNTSLCNGIVLRSDTQELPQALGCATNPNLEWMLPLLTAIGSLQAHDGGAVNSGLPNSGLVNVTVSGDHHAYEGGTIFDSGEVPVAAESEARSGARYVQVSADAADAQGCGNNPARYRFSLTSEDRTVSKQLTGGGDDGLLTACDGESQTTSGAAVASTLAPASVRWEGGSFSLQIANDPESTSGGGDDGAIDDIRVDDVTPTVSLGADVAPVKAGETAQLTVTVANTPDSRGRLDGKAGWGFTLNLPAGMELAAEPESPVAYAASAAAGEETTATECPAAIQPGDNGARNSVRVSDGELAPGQSSCTVTIPVRQTAGYDPGRTVRPTLTSDSLTGLDGIDRAASGRTEQVLTFTDAVAPTVPALQPSAGAAVSGVAEAGATVTVASSAATCAGEGDAADETATATAGTDGAFTVRLPRRQPDGSSLFVSVADAAGNRSACTQLMVLADPPPAPDVSGVADGVATGTALPGTTVVVTDASGSTLVQAPVDENGRFRLRVAAPVGSEVALFSQDAAGNRSEPVTVRVAPAAEAAPASNRPVAAHPLARDESPAPTPARTLPRTGLTGTGWPAAIALLLLTGAGLAVLARAGRRRPLPGAAPDEGARR